MAGLGPEDTLGSSQKDSSLPEVPLRWSDFVWSLEKLRHRPYGEKTRERDWFRINPLEIVLLGTQSIATESHAKRDHGTMMLVMPSLRHEMLTRPRYWYRLISVLYLATQRADTPPNVLQKCCTALIDLLQSIKRIPEVYPAVFAWATEELKLTKGLEGLLEERKQALGIQVRSRLDSLVDSLHNTVKSAQEGWEELNTTKTLSTEELLTQDKILMKEFLMAVLDNTMDHPNLHMQVQMLKGDRDISSVILGTNWEPYRSLFKVVCDTSNQAVGKLLSIFQLIFVRSKELVSHYEPMGSDQTSSPNQHTSETDQTFSPNQHTSDTNQTSSPDQHTNQTSSPDQHTSETDQTSSDQDGDKTNTNETTLEGGLTQKEAIEEVVSEDEGRPHESLVAILFKTLTSCIKKWEELSVRAGTSPNRSSLSVVVCKLLSLTEVILSARALHKSIPEAVQFFQSPISILMTYSTEGYLSDSPNEFLLALLEFFSSVVEQGTPPLKVIQNNLPNLFGPAFGIRNHSVSCQLLEYGSLAACSQHKKSLLTEGLKFLIDVFHLFPPIDEVKAHAVVATLREEALAASSQLLEDILSTLPLETDKNEQERPETVTFEPEKVESPAALEEHTDIDGTSPVGESSSKETGELAAGSGELVAGRGEQLKSLCVEQPPLVTDQEREADRDARLQVLLKLMQLACTMVRKGDNISFIFASILPKLFRQTSQQIPVVFNIKKLQQFFGEDPPPPASNIPWNVDKKKLAIQLLNLTILSLDNDVATPFELCGIVAPKLVKNIDIMSLSDDEKLYLTMDVLKTTQDVLEEGHNITDFISHGIDLLSNLIPVSATVEEFREFANQLARHFVTSSQSSFLFLIKNACQFMTKNFPDEERGVRDLFRALVFRGKRDEIRGVFRVCKAPLKEDKYSVIRQSMYNYSSGQLSHRQLVALCELLVVVMDVETPKRAVREVVTNVDEDREQLDKDRMEEEKTVIIKLTAPCLKSIEDALKEKKFKKEVWERISRQLSQVTLFRTLFQSDFTSYSCLDNKQLLEVFTNKFPPEVMASEEMMHLLAQCATRIEHMQTPRYDSLKLLLSSHLRYFLTLATPTSLRQLSETTPTPSEETPRDTAALPLEETESTGGGVEQRMCSLEQYLESLPRNVEDRQQLVGSGYSNRLWDERLSLTVKTDGTRSLEENMRQTLLACYREFSEMLKQMAITHVSVDGEMVKSAELFSDELSLAELKGRRAVAVRVIDQRLGQSKDGHFYERKVTLLSREDEIESDFEKQASAPVKPKTFTVTLNTGFFDCARCCGSQIIGCYAPTGEHCERPLEIGMRCDSAMASIYDEAGMEIENIEILFTQEGSYIFKAYSNGHPYDTSQVWTNFLVTMLKEEPSPLVPAIIVPSGYPNTRTWEALRRAVSTEITGSVLTCRHDFSSEWRTYYDHRPDRVRLGTDIVLTPGFNFTSSEGRPSFQRQRSHLTKDLAGVIFEGVMQKLLEEEWLKQFRFLGKVVSEYVSVFVREGERKVSILENGFNYERWGKTFSKAKQGQEIPSKDAIIRDLLSFVDKEIEQWLEDADVTAMCAYNHKQLLELKECFELTRTGCMPEKLHRVRDLLDQCTFIVPILSLPDALQEEIIHWVFGNEDRVWRYRGGRDGHETLQQFMSFLGRQPLFSMSDRTPTEGGVVPKTHIKVYPGVVAFCLPEAVDIEDDQPYMIDTSSLQVRQMIGYAVGESMKPVTRDDLLEEREEGVTRWHPNKLDQCYEVVTAWVHPSYRGLNLGVQMYFNIVQQAPARLVMCDMLVGSVERIIQSNIFLRLLRKLKIVGMVIQKRQLSYTVITQAGQSEQFEQVLFDTRPLRLMLRVQRVAAWCKTHPKFSTTMAMVAIVFAVPIAALTAVKLM